MSDPHATVSEKEGLPSSDRTEGVLSLQKTPDSIRAFFHRLRARLRPQSCTSSKSHRPFSKKKRLARPISQQSSSKNATVSRQPDQVFQNASASKQLATSPLQPNHDNTYHSSQDRNSSLSYLIPHFPSSPSYAKTDGLNATETPSGINKGAHPVPKSSVKSLPDKRRLCRLETKGSRMSSSSETQPTLTATSRATPLRHSRIDEEPNETDERERTLRILESGDKPVTHRSCSPATIRRRRRSYQLATDPHIEPQQYSDFLRYLEREITTDIALRLQIWKSLTGESGNRVASLINPDPREEQPISEVACYTDRHIERSVLDSHDKPHRRSGPSHRRPKSCTSIDHSKVTGWQDRKSKGGSWNRIDKPRNHKLDSILGDENESFRVHDHSSALESIKIHGRRRSAVNPSFEHSRCIDPSEKASLQLRNLRRRQGWSQQGIPLRQHPDRKRESTSSLTHVIAQYIKPEMPRTIYRDSQYQSHEISMLGNEEMLS